MQQKPNILLLMSDQMQGARLGIVDPKAYTPNLDKLASEGVFFPNAISCHGQCIPSRAGFLTGSFPHECGVMVNTGFFGHQNQLVAGIPNLAGELKKAGYRTAYFGKAHLGADLHGLGIDTTNEHTNQPMTDEEAAEKGIAFASKGARNAHYRGFWDTMEFLRDYQPDDTPLFLTYSTNLPHSPFFSVPEHIDRFPVEDIELPESYEDIFEGKPAFQKAHIEDGHHGAQDVDKAKLEAAQYYSMIAAADEHCGKVMDEFRRLGIWDNTIVLFMSDHGDMLNAHGTRKKGTLPYEEIYRVPCIFKLASGQTSKRSRIEEVVSSTSFAGTLLKLAGCNVPESFTGGHLCDAFDQSQTDDNAHVFFEHYAAYWGTHPFYGVRTNTMKWIRYYGEDNAEEMYDLAADPNEMVNVAFDPAYAGIRTELAERADTWWHETNGRDLEYYESDLFRHNPGILKN